MPIQLQKLDEVLAEVTIQDRRKRQTNGGPDDRREDASDDRREDVPDDRDDMPENMDEIPEDMMAEGDYEGRQDEIIEGLQQMIDNDEYEGEMKERMIKVKAYLEEVSIINSIKSR